MGKIPFCMHPLAKSPTLQHAFRFLAAARHSYQFLCFLPQIGQIHHVARSAAIAIRKKPVSHFPPP